MTEEILVGIVLLFSLGIAVFIHDSPRTIQHNGGKHDTSRLTSLLKKAPLENMPDEIPKKIFDELDEVLKDSKAEIRYVPYEEAMEIYMKGKPEGLFLTVKKERGRFGLYKYAIIDTEDMRRDRRDFYHLHDAVRWANGAFIDFGKCRGRRVRPIPKSHAPSTKKDPMTQEDYTEKREFLLDEASKANAKGIKGLEQEFMGKVQKLDAKYADECVQVFEGRKCQ